MSSVNKVILVGNLGADPELKYTTSGKAVAEMRLATSWGAGDKQETEWHRVILWDKQAEFAAGLNKGNKVYVEGRIKTRSYDDKDGVKKYVTEIVANELRALSPKDKPSEESAPAPSSTRRARGNKPPKIEADSGEGEAWE